jgi:aminopeptidase N
MNLRLLCSGVLLGLSLMAVLPAQAQGRFRFDATPGHLSKQVVPSRYVLSFNLDPDRDSFTGQAVIGLQVRKEVASLEVHAFQLTNETARLLTAGKARALRVTALPESQTWRLEPTDGLPIGAGAHRIEIAYAGKVNVAGEGLFVAPYEAGGRKQRMLATQLEAIQARMLFPGFDEPAFRAVFEITVRAPKGYDVVSNMPRAARRQEGATTLHRFAPTPPMPSYLVSVAVGHLDVLRGSAAGVPLRILTAEGKRETARYAMQVTRQVLPFYNRYFGVPYALPKLDQFAVPSVRWGAMEDWGLISYAENGILVDPQRSGMHTVQSAYAFMAHEIAHQWFGNLVTAASWDEIWLNEAFATWLERKTTAHFNPNWKVPLQSRGPIDRAMTIDAGTATRAIRSGPVRESAVFDVFDSITYAKGGAVLAMLEQWIGPAAFRRGLVAYMKERRLSNATAADLWFHIGQASGKDVTAVAASWTDQQGFPLVQVSTQCAAGRQRVTLSQSRFSSRGASDSAQVWKIPLRVAHGGRLSTLLLDTPQHSVEVGACSTLPVIVNAGGTGFYRVAYEGDNMQALTRRFVDLPETDRATLLSDSFALMQSGRLPLQNYLDVLQALPAVHDASRATLWSLTRSQLDFLDTALAGGPAQARLRAIARALLAPQLDALGWTPPPNEDALTAAMRGNLVEQLTRFDHAPTIAQAQRAFDDDEAGTRPLSAALREQVTVAVGMHADAPRFERLLAQLKAATGEEERWMFAKALASGRDAPRAERLLASALENVVPANIASAIPGMVAERSPFGELAYRFTLEHWQALAELSGTWGRQFLLPSAAEGFNTSDAAERLAADQRRLAGADGDRLAAQEAENIRLRAAVRQREAPGLEATSAN